MTGRGTTVLVLGAYGQVGRAVVDELRARTDLSILATGRNEARLRALGAEAAGRVHVRRLDVGDEAALRRACAEALAVVNCVGPYLEHGERVARSALEAGAACIDVASEQEHFRRLLRRDAEARARGVALVTGAGLYPGLSGLLLAALRAEHPETLRAEVLLAAGRSTSEEVGSAALLSAVYELAYPLEELRGGSLRVTEPGAPATRRRLPPPFGPTTLIPWPQLEILAAARGGGLEGLRAQLAFAGLRPLPRPALRLLRRLAPERRPALRRLLGGSVRWLHRRAWRGAEARRLGTATLVGAEVADAERRFTATLAAPDGALATAWLPVLLVERLAATGLPGGLATPMDLVGLEETLAWLRVRGHAFELIRSTGEPECASPGHRP